MTDRPEGPAERRARVTRIAARALVRLYPRAFRRRFGRAMVDDLARMVADGRSRAGTRGAAAAWVRAFRDLGRSLPAAWRAGRGERGGKHGRVTGTGGTMRIGAVVQDVRWAARGLRRSPGFTVLAVGVLAVAVAGVATGAALVDAYLLQGLPYPAAERLVSVAPPTLPWDDADPSVVEHALTWDLDVFTLVDGERPELVRSAWISPGFQEGFGLTPALGRLFRPDEFREGAAPVALLGHALWQGRYGGDPGIVGRSVTLYASDRPDDAEVFTVVGVLPRDFWYHNAYAEMLAPLRRPNPLYMARLRPGVPLAEAERTLTAAARRSGAEVPPEGIRLRRLEEAYTASVRPALGVLEAAALLVLLLACSNTAVLQLVRAAGREQELSVRRALGAGRARIARHLLSEGLLLAGAATGLGLLAAAVLCGLLAGPLESRLGVGIPGGAGALAVNGRVTVMAVALGGLAGLGFGPASGAAPSAGRSPRVAARRRTASGVVASGTCSWALSSPSRSRSWSARASRSARRGTSRRSTWASGPRGA
jgi:putative ABC transport system permease protein